MAQEWLGPAIFGGGATIASSLLTLSVQAIISTVGKKRERRDKRQDAGREQAKTVLTDIHAVRTSSLDGKYPDPRTRHYSFNPDEVKKVKDDVALVTDEVTRERVTDAFNCLLALGPAEHELKHDRFAVERSLVGHAERIVAAYARGDKVPKTSVAFITETKKTVDAAWDQEAKSGTTYPM